ncbi:Mak10 subunit, NatC N-terminal acetyltransferase-domain-containing protein [Auriculariales sp. MPI-PUGE-AT-0066]|nr:Mak10 subunit, NatC N-terminal acetyltransferase-domain-containing protein [Auriculariales sp. MPI-PUGE-AT-0066]
MFGDIFPGGHGFTDVYNLVEHAAYEMKPNELLLMDNFGLQDAMSAIEIMDERMDSGTRPPDTTFNPSTLLLPQEVLWILDRTFAAEMTWHSGSSLAQSVLTIQHMHHIQKLHPDVLPRRKSSSWDRRPEHVGLVLRAGVLAFVKCIDLAWRELSKNNVHDGEDWHSEKFEVSLCEAVASATVVDSLDEALAWLRKEHRYISMSPQPTQGEQDLLLWYTLLVQRLELRRALLLALSRNLPSEGEELRVIVHDAETQLDLIRQSPPPPEPTADSPASVAIDPHIYRHLTVLMPVKIIPLFDQLTAWHWLQCLLSGLSDIGHLSSCERLLSWQTYARINAWTFETPQRSPFLRSLLMTAFMSGTMVLGRFQSPWLVDHYLAEVARVPQATLVHLHESGMLSMVSQNGISSASFLQNFENDVIVCLRDYYYSFFSNRPRQRRKLSNLLVKMHRLHAQAADVVDHAPAVEGMVFALQLLRLSAISEVVTTGFELQLYSREEDPFVIWHAIYVLELKQDLLRDLLKHLYMLEDSENISALESATSELEFTTGLQAAMKGNFFLVRLLNLARPQDPERLKQNVERRYKWAFHRDYANIKLEDEAKPDLDFYAIAPEHNVTGPSLLHEAEKQFDSAFIRNLIDICTSNSGFLRVAQTHQNPVRWEVKLDRWFQRITGFSVQAAKP